MPPKQPPNLSLEEVYDNPQARARAIAWPLLQAVRRLLRAPDEATVRELRDLVEQAEGGV